MEIILVLIFIALLVAIFLYRKRIDDQEAQQNTSTQQPLTLFAMQAGGVLSISGAADDGDDLTVTVTAKHEYREGSYSWFELEGHDGNDTVWLDFEQDDTLEISLTKEEIPFRTLGLSSDDLDEFDDEEEGTFSFRNEKFHYDESDKALFFRNGNHENPEKLYYWDFTNDLETQFISIERWGKKEFKAYRSIPIDPERVTIFRTQEDENTV
jgi:hypothetical protein